MCYFFFFRIGMYYNYFILVLYRVHCAMQMNTLYVHLFIAWYKYFAVFLLRKSLKTIWCKHLVEWNLILRKVVLIIMKRLFFILVFHILFSVIFFFHVLLGKCILYIYIHSILYTLSREVLYNIYLHKNTMNNCKMLLLLFSIHLYRIFPQNWREKFLFSNNEMFSKYCFL